MDKFSHWGFWSLPLVCTRFRISCRGKKHFHISPEFDLERSKFEGFVASGDTFAEIRVVSLWSSTQRDNFWGRNKFAFQYSSKRNFANSKMVFNWVKSVPALLDEFSESSKGGGDSSQFPTLPTFGEKKSQINPFFAGAPTPPSPSLKLHVLRDKNYGICLRFHIKASFWGLLI